MIKVGDRLPAGHFPRQERRRLRQRGDDRRAVQGPEGGLRRRPRRLHPTCHYAHIPQFVANAATLKDNGVDRIVVMAVNDHHVMKSWGEALGGDGKIDFVADGNADYANALGLDVASAGLGTRVKRFSMLVDDGVVKTLNFEPEGGKGIQATGAATMLSQL